MQLFKDIIQAQSLGQPKGIYAVCSANPFLLTAAMMHARNKGTRLLIEATSNQVNQTRSNLGQMVSDGFAILKMGPALTFAFREALFGLLRIENELLSALPGRTGSSLMTVLMDEMRKKNHHWKAYYAAAGETASYWQIFSFFDRIRYFWPIERVRQSIQTLLANLNAKPIPLPLISQFFPAAYPAIRNGELAPQPEALIYHKIMEIIDQYASACGMPEEAFRR